MALTPISGEIISQTLNDNFSSLQTEITEHKADFANKVDQNILYMKDYGILNSTEDPAYDCVPALALAIADANTLLGQVTIKFPMGSFNFGAASGIPDIAKDWIYIVGEGKGVTKLNLTSGTYFTWSNISATNRGGGLYGITISYTTPDLTNSTVLIKSATTQVFDEIFYTGGCTFIEAGDATYLAYSVTIKNTQAIIANLGKPFVKLVNGAGFYWNDFGKIYHTEATAPIFNDSSVMNTIAGTNVIDIVGDWDTIDISLFVEKMYRVINIDGTVAGTNVFNIRMYDMVCDYIRDSVLYAVMTGSGSSLVSVSIDNVYFTTWEGHGFYVEANATDFRNVTFDNTYCEFAGKSGVYLNAIATKVRRLNMSNCRFMGTSRVDATLRACYLTFVDGAVIKGNRFGGSDINGNITWGADVGLTLNGAAFSSSIDYLIEGNIGSEFEMLNLPTSPVTGNASKSMRCFNNVFRGAGANYEGWKTTAPFTKPATVTDWYNVTPYDVQVFIGGTSVTEIQLDGTVLPVVSGIFKIEPGHYFQITYIDTNNADVNFLVNQ